MRCEKCQAIASDHHRFCPFCGSPLVAVEAATPDPPQVSLYGQEDGWTTDASDEAAPSSPVAADPAPAVVALAAVEAKPPDAGGPGEPADLPWYLQSDEAALPKPSADEAGFEDLVGEPQVTVASSVPPGGDWGDTSAAPLPWFKRGKHDAPAHEAPVASADTGAFEPAASGERDTDDEPLDHVGLEAPPSHVDSVSDLPPLLVVTSPPPRAPLPATAVYEVLGTTQPEASAAPAAVVPPPLPMADAAPPAEHVASFVPPPGGAATAVTPVQGGAAEPAVHADDPKAALPADAAPPAKRAGQAMPRPSVRLQVPPWVRTAVLGATLVVVGAIGAPMIRPLWSSPPPPPPVDPLAGLPPEALDPPRDPLMAQPLMSPAAQAMVAPPTASPATAMTPTAPAPGPTPADAKKLAAAKAAAVAKKKGAPAAHMEAPAVAAAPEVAPTPLPATTLPSPPPAPVAAPPPAEPVVPTGPTFEVTQVDVKPQIEKSVPARYPSEVREPASDVVVLRVLIGPNGTPADVRVLRKSRIDAALDRAAVAAVRQWKFSPAKKRAQAVSCWYSVGVQLSPSVDEGSR